MVIIEGCNFVDFPNGGQLTMAKNLASQIQEELYIIGVETDNREIGVWRKENLLGKQVNRINVLAINNRKFKPAVPYRLQFLFGLLKYRKQLVRLQEAKTIIQTPEALLAMNILSFKNVCYIFAGTNNPIKYSRYKFARIFGSIYNIFLYLNLNKMRYILASATDAEIEKLYVDAGSLLKRRNIISFPTRVDTEIFRPMDRTKVREKLGMPENEIVLVVTGRIAEFKGWRLLVDAFLIFSQTVQKTRLVFIGEGEDRIMLQDYISKLELTQKVIITGYQSPSVIAEYLNAADAFLMGSFMEGWSTTLVEAIVTGVPVCVTDFSSAEEIITLGINGYIVKQRDPKLFADYIVKTVSLGRNLNQVELDIVKYGLKTLEHDLFKVTWSNS